MRNGFFEDTDILAADLQAAGRALMTNGVLLDEADALKVIAAGGMKAAIKTGTAWLNGAYVTNEATAALTLTTADGVLNRIDRIVIRRDDIQGQIYGVVLTGVAAATPTPPAIVRDGTYYDLCLATINISAGTTAITDAMITDNRGDATLCPVACARTGILAEIATKADKTYCDDTFATKAAHNSIVDGTIKTNANKLQGFVMDEIIDKSMLKRVGDKIISIVPGATILNATTGIPGGGGGNFTRQYTLTNTNYSKATLKLNFNNGNGISILRLDINTINDSCKFTVKLFDNTDYTISITVTNNVISATFPINNSQSIAYAIFTAEGVF